MTTTARTTLIRRITGLILATAAMFFGFALASNASTAHADSVAGNAVFHSEIACGGDELVFTVNSDADYDSYAQLWVWDPATEQWVTDEIWVEANYYATANIADLTFEPGYYMVYVSYAQWNNGGWEYSGEYIDTYQQYYTSSYHETSDYCYMGN
jgi:hypothetical protein